VRTNRNTFNAILYAAQNAKYHLFEERDLRRIRLTRSTANSVFMDSVIRCENMYNDVLEEMYDPKFQRRDFTEFEG